MKVALGAAVAMPVGALAGVSVEHNLTLRELAVWSVSDEAANFWQVLMAIEGLFAVPAAVLGVTEHFRLRRKELEEAVEKRLAEQAAEEQRRADKLEDQRIERKENTLKLRELYAQHNARYGELELWYATACSEVRSKQLRYGENNRAVREEIAQNEATYNSRLLGLFEQGYIDFYEPDDREYDEYWEAVEGDIKQKLSEPYFRAQLADLLTDDTNADFRRYMEEKIADLSMIAAQALQKAGPSPETLH